MAKCLLIHNWSTPQELTYIVKNYIKEHPDQILDHGQFETLKMTNRLYDCITLVETEEAHNEIKRLIIEKMKEIYPQKTES